MATATQRAPVPAHEITFEPRALPKLRANHGQHLDHGSVGWMRASPCTLPMEELRKRYEEDGYVWVKNLMPREEVYDMREHYFTQLASTGILLPGTSARQGIFNHSQDPLSHQSIGATPEGAAYIKLLETAHTTPEYRQFLEHPALRDFVRTFMQWEHEVLVPRAMLRHNVPHSLSTGIHYDQIFLRAGEADFLTAWLPIGDCAATGGGLMYLENGSRLGEEIEKDFTKGAEGMTREQRINAFNVHMGADGTLSQDAAEFLSEYHADGFRWLVADFEAGDVVFHNPYMIHGALKNEDDQGRIRLASDLRFYESDEVMDQRWNKVWTHGDKL
ncbi:MAG: T-complex protein 1 subunit beta [Chaenotheca gracillima]|nr:MAG: T-complex protein 1 subunit beta [Chaenotheca gracillima]